MNRQPGRTFLLWLLAMLAGAAIVWNSRFTADMSFFLPAHPTAEQQVLVDQLKEGVVSRLLMIAVDGGNSAQRAALSRELRGRLEKRLILSRYKMARPVAKRLTATSCSSIAICSARRSMPSALR